MYTYLPIRKIWRDAVMLIDSMKNRKFAAASAALALLLGAVATGVKPSLSRRPRKISNHSVMQKIYNRWLLHWRMVSR
jgi:hypothetical protein